MELKRVESVWDYVYDLNLDMPSLLKGLERVIVRPNRFNPTIIQSAFYGLGIDEVPIKMKELQRMCRGRCKSLKMFFQAECQLA